MSEDDAVQREHHHGYHLYVTSGVPAGDALAAANRRMWSRFGRRSQAAAPDLPLSGEDFARQIYPSTLERQWVETTLGGRMVGAIAFNRSYRHDAWFCGWFNQLRSAYGMYVWGDRLGQDLWRRRALATRDLVLSAPQDRGLFPTVFAFGDTPADCRWTHSHHQGGGPGIYHLADMSWTVTQLLRWHSDLLPDATSVRFARDYCRGILALQRGDGGLPSYVDATGFRLVGRVDKAALGTDLERHPGGDGYVAGMLRHVWPEERFLTSAEDAASLQALAETARALPADDPDRQAFLAGAGRIADWLEQAIFPEAKWIDFEVYYSCSPKPLDFFDRRSGQWPQNTLPMHFAAAGLLALHELTREQRHLDLAQRALERLMLYQQVWSPPWLNHYGFGGYGAMNTDGEWNDARQAQFADTHLDFHRVTGDIEQLERARAAARAAFTTVYLPACSGVYPQGWQRQAAGQAAENHGHHGRDGLNGCSGFDWGSGSALATAAYFARQGIDL